MFVKNFNSINSTPIAPINTKKRSFEDSFKTSEHDYIRKTEDKVEEVMKIYKNSLYFHGTSKKNAKSIEASGMQFSKKVEGATSILKRETGLDDKESFKYHYVMDKEQAAFYAKMHKKPTLVKIILPPSIFTLTFDHEANVFGKEFKVNKNIDTRFILPLHKKDLSTDRVKLINQSLNIDDLTKKELKLLKKRIRSEIIGSKNSDKLLINSSIDFIKEQKEQSIKELKILESKISDLSKLKEGAIFCLSPSELEDLVLEF